MASVTTAGEGGREANRVRFDRAGVRVAGITTAAKDEHLLACEAASDSSLNDMVHVSRPVQVLFTIIACIGTG